MRQPIKTELVVVGAGPGGYAAAFYAADLGKKVLLVERDEQLGGVCLNRGCIPSKALLHAAHTINLARDSAHRGIAFADPHIDLDKLRGWKDSVLAKLAGGVAQLARTRGVEVLRGRGYFEDSQMLRVETEQGQQFINYDHAIVAVGSKSALPKAWDLGNPRVMTSREALQVEEIPERLLVIGGGYIGLELGTVYATLGSKVALVEALDTILAGADLDLARPVIAAAKKAFQEVRVKAKVGKMATAANTSKWRSNWTAKRKRNCTIGCSSRLVASRIPKTSVSKIPRFGSTTRGSSWSMKNNRPPTPPFMPSATSPAAFCSPTRQPAKGGWPPK